MRPLLTAGIALLLLTSCVSRPPTTPSAPSPVSPPTQPQPQPEAQRYRFDPAASSVHILVYRGGTLARLGHNHVISAPRFNGYLWRDAKLTRSGFDISVPVNELVVDDDAARAAAGADFPLNVKPEAKQGTRNNMLGTAVLDAAQFPEIRLRSVAVQGEWPTPQVVLAMTLRDQTRELSVPVSIAEGVHGLTIRGEFTLRQSDFGITPFSVAMGALQVVDEVTVRLVLVAVPE